MLCGLANLGRVGCLQVLAETLGWIATAVDEFGAAKLDVRQLINWCIADLDSRDATVRSAVRVDTVLSLITED